MALVFHWPFGVALTAWSYMWRTTVMHRRELEGSWPQDGPPTPTGTVDLDGVQRPEDGSGPLFRRRYRVRIDGADRTAEALMRDIHADPNHVAPGRLAHFEKLAGRAGELRPGDEFKVRMPGPWDGPIRVLEVTPRSFRAATLAGHLEAGQVEWRAATEDGRLVFEIESWARAGDRLSALLHDRARMAKEVQLYMWTSVLERVAQHVGGRASRGIDIETRRVSAQSFAPRGEPPE